MTREEAIVILDGFKHNPLFNGQHFEALDMAISALSAEGELISRQAVDRLVWKYLRSGTDENIAFYEHFLDLSSVENKREFERMTNGEAIKALFPNGKVIECDEATGYEQMLDDENSYCSWFDSLWWNAPYKAESEGQAN